MGNALTAPVINDVSTDLEQPPAFTQSNHQATLPDSFKKVIQKHYSHLKPVTVPGGDIAVVFAATKRAVAALPRASIVREDREAGVLELLDVTPLMKFKDDVAVRVQQEADQVVVDVRSASRLGKGDLGANAARIGKYLEALKAELAGGSQQS